MKDDTKEIRNAEREYKESSAQSREAAGYAADHFLLEMQEVLKNKLDPAHKFIDIGAYTSADKATAQAECLEFVISRYKQNKQAGLC